MIDTLTGALLGAITALTGALSWMTIGRFQDREKFADKTAQLYKELAEAQKGQIERVFELTHAQSAAVTAHAAALVGMKEQLERVVDATNETTAAVNGIVRDVVRDARAGRRTVSDTTMQAVKETVDRALEDRRRGGGK